VAEEKFELLSYFTVPSLTLSCFFQAFLGAGAVALGLVVTAPFANIEGPSLSLPSGDSRPAVEKVAAKKSAAAAKMKGPKGYNLDVSDDNADARKAARAEAEAAKKAASEKLAQEKAAAKEAAAAAVKAAKEEAAAAKAEAAAAAKSAQEEGE